MDLSSAQYVQMITPGTSPIPRSLRTGALFVFRGGLEELLVVSPDLESISEEPREDYFFLGLEFTTSPGKLLEKLKNFELISPAFVIIRMEEKKNYEMLVGPVWSWEQGYFIAGIVVIEEKRIVFAVKKGLKN